MLRAHVMQLGVGGVFVGSGIFKSDDPQAVHDYRARGHDSLQGLVLGW
jgi:pyridoxal biosynthesis lyase PdxS